MCFILPWKTCCRCCVVQQSAALGRVHGAMAQSRSSADEWWLRLRWRWLMGRTLDGSRQAGMHQRVESCDLKFSFFFFFHFKGKEMMQQVNRGRQSLQRYWVTSWGGRLWNEFWSWIMIHVLNGLVVSESWNSSMWMLMGNGENGSTKRKMHQLPFKTSFLIKQTSLYYFIFYFFTINIGV